MAATRVRLIIRGNRPLKKPLNPLSFVINITVEIKEENCLGYICIRVFTLKDKIINCTKALISIKVEDLCGDKIYLKTHGF
jgi:hypothetical protein